MLIIREHEGSKKREKKSQAHSVLMKPWMQLHMKPSTFSDSEERGVFRSSVLSMQVWTTCSVICNIKNHN